MPLSSRNATTKLQELVLHEGARSVVDVSWSGRGNGYLRALLRGQSQDAGEDAAETPFYGFGEGGARRQGGSGALPTGTMVAAVFEGSVVPLQHNPPVLGFQSSLWM